MPATLDKITDFPALVDYLRDELEWPIAADISLDEATYDVTPEEIGLKSSVVGGGIEIKQLRPLNRAQPWGVFFLNLPSAKLPVTLVRNILGRLAIKKRASANKSEQAAFAKHDLLFIAATGSAPDRRLAFAHFADDEVKGDAATLKVLGWDADDTPRRLGLTEASLKTKLHWPDDPADADGWRKQWGEAFAHADTRTVVRESKQMAKELAALARRIRDRARELIAAQTANGSLVKLHKAFKEALIHDLTPEGFADTYAQTIAYGLLSTAISRASGALTQDDMAANVAGTSPFLKEMLGTFIEAGGRKTGKAQGLDFDELGITDVVELLRNADMKAVLADFDRKNPDEDPVIHFYELFLKEYDAAQKVKRGVFYTPRPVVGFIVRSVDEVLRTEFGLEDGLASTATWGEVIAASKGKEGAAVTLPEGAKESDPFVRILDPATGTGTFLVECVDLIHKTMVAKWKAAGKRAPEIKTLWNAYVPAHLLPRLTGFELMMAPYAIAHVKLGLKLADTGYTFGSDARAQIYLTNALEPAQDLDMQLAFMSEALAHEAKAANTAKETRFTVVLGNPPYNGYSANNGKWIDGLMDAYKVNVRDDERQIQRLSNDYVKFFRIAQWVINCSGTGVSTYIVDSGFLDGLLFRDMRQSLLADYDSLSIVDLHGESVRGAHDRDRTDENVFEITQPNCVILSVMHGSRALPSYVSIRGPQSDKYARLNQNTVRALAGEPLNPRPSAFLLNPREVKLDFEDWPSLPTLLGTGNEKKDRDSRYGTGIKSRHDHFAIGWDPNDSVERILQIANRNESDAKLKQDLGLCSTAHFSIGAARARAASGDLKTAVRSVSYRPFDMRSAVYLRQFICEPKASTMKHQIGLDNIALCFLRKNRRETGSDAMVGKGLIAKDYVSDLDDALVWSLWLAPEGTETRTLPNIAPAFTARVAALTGLTYDDCVEGPKQGTLGGILPKKAEQTAMFAPAWRERGEPGKSFGPRDLFDYIYAVLHSPAYRARYADYLKSDFARIPLPGSRALFEALVPIGTELVALHLLDADALLILKDPKGIRLAGSGEARLAHKPEYNAKLGRVTINATRWFESVPQVAWDFHVGGYQPAQKWLKDRAAKGGKKASPGRVLSDDDIVHYRRMIVALTRTAELMPTIDAVVEKHGGWPGAFRGMTDEAAAEPAAA